MSSHRRPTARALHPLRILIALALSVLVLPVMAVPAFAAGPSSIDLDGNQSGASTDWEGWKDSQNGNLAEGFSVIKDGIGNGDTTGITGQERDYDGADPEGTWVADPATASKKSDIGTVLVDSFRVGGVSTGDLIAVIGFDRKGDTGTQRYYIELNQAPSTSLMPTRTVGDIRVIIGINGSAIEECQGYQLWTTSGTWGDVRPCTGIITFDVNEAPIADFFGSPNAVNGLIPANQFMEVRINLTLAGTTTCPAAGFTSFNMRTQEGNENGDTGQLKDVIQGPINIPSDCGAIEIIKLDALDDTPLAGATFQIAPNPDAGGPQTGSSTVTDDDTVGGVGKLTDTDPRDGYIKVTNVVPGISYTVTEMTPPAGYFLPPTGCDSMDDTDRCTTKTVGTGQTATFSFKDKRQYAAPTITKTADGTVATSYTWQIEKTVSNTQNDANATDSASQNVGAGGAATFYYGLKVTGTKNVGTYSVGGTVTVKNPNEFGPMVVTVSDKLHDNTTCTLAGTDYDSAADGFQVNLPSKLVAPNGVTLTYSCSPTVENPQPGNNTARVTWNTGAYPQTAEQAWAQTPGTDYREASDGYTYEDAGETNKAVSVVDTYAEFKGPRTVTYDPTDLTDGKYVETFAYSHTFANDPPGVCTPHVNTAKVLVLQTQPDPATLAQDSATATVCSGANLTVAKNKIVSLTRTYAYSIDKSVASSSLVVGSDGKATANYTVVVTEGSATDSNWTMSGQITVDNPNQWDVTLASISDVYAGTNCAVVQGANLLIPKDDLTTQAVDEGQRTFTYTCLFTSKPPYAGTNTATITWDKAAARTSSGTASGTAQVVESDWTLSQVNPTVTVVDNKTVAGQSITLGTVTWSQAGKAHTYTYSLQLQGSAGRCIPYTNTARISETGQSDSATVTVCWPVSPTVSKTAAGSYDRTYLWAIDKGADQTSVETDGENGTEVNYTVTATPDGYVDDGWAMSGTITVSNPNDFQSMTVDITDTPNIGGGATCAVINGDDVVVPAGSLVNGQVVPGTATRSYTCTVPQQPLYTGGTNTATITWAGGSASSGALPVVFAVDDETDEVVTVVDDKTVEGEEVELGDATWNDDDEPTVFTYSLDLEAEANECVDYVNTAEILETGQFVDVTVEACGPEVLPDEVVVPQPRPAPEVKGVDTVLPATGGPQLGLTWAALALLLAGGALIISSRTRRSRT